MMEFFRGLFGRRESSGSTAKERLKVVLISDHLSLAPDVVQALKVDLIEVISRYLEIDHQAADVTFEPRDGEIAMLANIPVLGVRDASRRAAAVPAPMPQTPAPSVAPVVPNAETEADLAETHAETPVADRATPVAASPADAVVETGAIAASATDPTPPRGPSAQQIRPIDAAPATKKAKAERGAAAERGGAADRGGSVAVIDDAIDA